MTTELPEPSEAAREWVKSVYGDKGLHDPWPRLLAQAWDAGRQHGFNPGIDIGKDEGWIAARD